MPSSTPSLREASRRLSGHLRGTPAQMLTEAAHWCEARGVSWDAYGTGRVVEEFEARVADLLGFPAARFLPSGTMAQTIAMRVWCDRAGTRTFAMHPTSHLELHEQRGYAHLFGLHAQLVGPRDRPLLADHLDRLVQPVGAILTELPIREAGGQLPTWEELEGLKQAAAVRGTPLHLDGARLWGCRSAYQRPFAEITAGFSSAYVSFYKGVAALSGAMLLGPADLLAEAAVWQRRAGGNLYTLLPNVVTAAMRLDRALEQMPGRLAHARALAAALREVDGIRVFPDPPHTAMFHVLMDMPESRAGDARNQVATSHGVWLFGGVQPGPAPGTCRTEITVGEPARALAPDEVANAFRALMREASTA